MLITFFIINVSHDSRKYKRACIWNAFSLSVYRHITALLYILVYYNNTYNIQQSTFCKLRYTQIWRPRAQVGIYFRLIKVKMVYYITLRS